MASHARVSHLRVGQLGVQNVLNLLSGIHPGKIWFRVIAGISQQSGQVVFVQHQELSVKMVVGGMWMACNYQPNESLPGSH